MVSYQQQRLTTNSGGNMMAKNKEKKLSIAHDIMSFLRKLVVI
ncbi:hypothetical protein [Prevotella koreensis]